VFFYSFHVYTEVPSALCVALALVLLLGPAPPTVHSAVAAGLLASALPWLHVKMVPCAAALAVIAVARTGARARDTFLATAAAMRSEEHTSELQSLTNLVCRLLLEKKNTTHLRA